MLLPDFSPRRLNDYGQLSQHLLQLYRRHKEGMAADRRKDAHEKIMLGGLVAKAGLRGENPAFILGVLLTAFEQKDNEKLRDAMIEKGRKAFEK